MPEGCATRRLLAGLILSTLATCLAMAGSASSTDKPKPWITKDWTQWTADDCMQVEYNSPWSHDVSTIVAGRYGDISTSLELRSALPVRQARLRSLQLKKRYDKMDVQKKQEFDQQYGFGSVDEYSDKVMVVITNVSNRPPRNANVESGVYAPDQAVQTALSLADGSLIQPVQITVLPPPSGVDVFGNEAEYVFPRTITGRPLFSPSDSLLPILLGAPLIVDKKTKKVEMQDFHGSGMALSFKISDLMYKGKLEY